MIRSGSVEITTVVGCSVDCGHCPQSLLRSAYGDRTRRMSLEDFDLCIDKIPKSVRIDFSGMAEPWLNRQCTEMVLSASKRGRPLAVYTTLVGMAAKDWDILKELSYEAFSIHAADSEGNSRIPVTEGYVALLTRIVSEGVKSKRRLSVSSHGLPHPAIAHLVPRGSTVLHDRAGNLDSPSKIRKTGPIRCRSCGNLMNRNVLLPDGTVVVCCMDYAMSHVLGNLKTSTYEEILNSVEANRVRGLLKRQDSEVLCRWCAYSEPVPTPMSVLRRLWGSARRRLSRMLPRVSTEGGVNDSQ
jgi:hypothetical protein